jgi:hypothetical protein
MSTICTLSMCAVLIAPFAVLAVPVQPKVQAQDNQSSVALSTEPSNTSSSPDACTVVGRPCNPKAPTCCPGVSCVFQGGSTRVGYACKLRRGAVSSSWELSKNILDDGELPELLR